MYPDQVPPVSGPEWEAARDAYYPQPHDPRLIPEHRLTSEYVQPKFQTEPNWSLPQYGQVTQPVKHDGFAVASLVLGILWLTWVGSALALIFGYVSRRKSAERGCPTSGLALAGIVLGWIGVGTLVLWILLVFLAAAGGSS